MGVPSDYQERIHRRASPVEGMLSVTMDRFPEPLYEAIKERAASRGLYLDDCIYEMLFAVFGNEGLDPLPTWRPTRVFLPINEATGERYQAEGLAKRDRAVQRKENRKPTVKEQRKANAKPRPNGPEHMAKMTLASVAARARKRSELLAISQEDSDAGEPAGLLPPSLP